MTSRATQFAKFAASIAVCSLGGWFVLSSPSFASDASLLAVDNPSTPDTSKPATINSPTPTPTVPNTPAATPTPTTPTTPAAPVTPAAPTTPVQTAPTTPTTPTAPVETTPTTPTAPIDTAPVETAPTPTAPAQPLKLMW